MQKARIILVRVLVPTVLAVAILAPGMSVAAASPQESSPAAASAPLQGGTYLGSRTFSEAQLQAAGLVTATQATGSGSRVALGVTPQTICLYDCIVARDKSFSYEGQVYETQAKLDRTRVDGSGTLTLDHTMTVSNSWNASFTIPVAQVTATMGFSVTSSVAIHFGDSEPVPAYSCRYILAYELYKVYKFNVYMELFLGDKKMGNGWAQNRDGVRFDVYSC
jgi:hypothetical protein